MSDENWQDAVRAALSRYDEALLRPVATKLCRPRNQWPVEELIDRSLQTLVNPAVVDRRLKDIPAATRRVLAVLRQSRQIRWPVARFCEIAAIIGAGVGHEAIVELIEAGLAFPDPIPGKGKLRHVATWLASTPLPAVLIPPDVLARTESEPIGLEGVLEPAVASGPVQEADGLEWILRLAILKQLVQTSPLRRTQSRDFFKRDLDRLSGDTLLRSPPGPFELPDPDLFAVAIALASKILVETDGEVRVRETPQSWPADLVPALTFLWQHLPLVSDWNPVAGWNIATSPGTPHASANLAAVVMLGQLPAEQWVRVGDVQTAIAERHPYWTGEKPAKTGVTAFLLGLAAPLRLVQLAKSVDEGSVIRLSPVGRRVLGIGPDVAIPTFPQTLLVQPNLEILAYRQGLSPELVARLGNIATWKALGAACTLQLEPASVYRALENGESLETIVQVFDNHGMKPTPTPVLDALKTWANKRDRITVYPSAALFEFASAADLAEALARGFPAVKITDRLAIVPRESDIEYKHFRLTGTRDYCLPPEKCVEAEADGVTLVVDLSRSDLLLETELMRFAEPHTRTPPPGRKLFRITPATLAGARAAGVTWPTLESWFEQRTGLPGSPAAKFLFAAKETPPVELRRQIVVHVANPETADGLLQWPETKALIQGRLGPATLVVADADVEPLSAVMRDLGIAVRFEN